MPDKGAMPLRYKAQSRLPPPAQQFFIAAYKLPNVG